MDVILYNKKEQLSNYITQLHIYIDIYITKCNNNHTKNYLNIFSSNNNNSANKETTCNRDIEFSADASMNSSTQHSMADQSLDWKRNSRSIKICLLKFEKV